jgi:hypothetical protein
MKMLDFWTELAERNRPLAYGGLAFLAMALVAAVLIPFDNRTVMGINPWIKPLKFDLSAAVYLWALGWLLYALADRFPASVRWISWGVLVCMVVEIICIKVQAVRGVTSHFNVATPLDGIIFGMMGNFIFINTLLTGYATVLFWVSSPAVEAAYLWGIRLGFVTFLLGSLVGVVMVMHNAHSVGVADGGAGLPLLNWSTIGGDLRAAHFVGMHALQLFPLAGYLLHRYHARGGRISPALLTVLFCLGYTLLAYGVFSRAMSGKPLVAVGNSPGTHQVSAKQ